MSSSVLLERLTGVRSGSGGGWRADCPNGHSNVKGSLSVSEAADGRVLMHCFACQDTLGILSSLNMTINDLYLPRTHDISQVARKELRESSKQNLWSAALGVLGREAEVVAIAAHDLINGQPLSADDHTRLTLSLRRINAAREVFA